MLFNLILALAVFTGSAHATGREHPTALVYKGTKSIPGEFPEVGWIGNCTGTLVAPNVVFTAGHCKSTGSRTTFQHRESGKTFSGTCTRHPNYNTRNIYNDFALCLLDTSVPAGSHLAQFETGQGVVKGEGVLINGFGQPNLVTHFWGLGIVSGFSGDQDIVTCGPANLGSGDSGGSLMKLDEVRTKAKVRKIVGVNSRGNNSCSWYNRVSHPNFVSFAKSFETKNNVELCGISKDCDKPAEPVDCPAIYESLGACLAAKDAACQDAYAKFKVCTVAASAQ